MIKKRFLTPPGAIVSYDYEDIVSGTGMVTFYGTGQEDSGGATKILSTFAENSPLEYITCPNGTTAYNIDSEPLNKDRTAKGVAQVVVIVNCGVANSATFKFKLQKISGGSATDISSEIESQNCPAGTNTFINLPLSLTETAFEKGDKIRLIFTAIAAGTLVKVGFNSIVTDPLGVSWTTSEFKLKMPWRIDL